MRKSQKGGKKEEEKRKIYKKKFIRKNIINISIEKNLLENLKRRRKGNITFARNISEAILDLYIQGLLNPPY